MTEKNRPALPSETSKNINLIVNDSFKGDKSLFDLSPLRAIKAYCADCGGTAYEVNLCTRDGVHSNLCPLFQYRKGRNPHRNGIGNHSTVGIGSKAELSVGFDNSIAEGGMQIPSETSNSSEGR